MEFQSCTGEFAMKMSKQMLTLILSCLLAGFNAQAESFEPAGQASGQAAAPSVQQSMQELQQLVAPIALYPDALVGQILAASTYPADIVEADRWMQNHPKLKGEELAKEVDQQPWDPSVKALTQFPSVLENMDKNLSWTSSLGEAYANQQQDVAAAVQALRQQARKAGQLSSNDQEQVTTQDNAVVIEPVDPDVVYVPAYDPWLVYGFPIAAYPGWYPVPGIFFDGPEISFGLGFGIGFFGGFGWGWHNWGYDWHGRSVMFNHNTYMSHSRTIVNRNNFSSSNFNQRSGNFNHSNTFRGGGTPHGNSAVRGPSFSHGQQGTRSSAFSGFDHGGNVRGFSSRGRSSFGGFNGGGFHGGGFHGGGRHR
jgi:hypothetical protein